MFLSTAVQTMTNYHTVLVLQHERNALQLPNLKMPRQITMNPNATFR